MIFLAGHASYKGKPKETEEGSSFRKIAMFSVCGHLSFSFTAAL